MGVPTRDDGHESVEAGSAGEEVAAAPESGDVVWPTIPELTTPKLPPDPPSRDPGPKVESRGILPLLPRFTVMVCSAGAATPTQPL